MLQENAAVINNKLKHQFLSLSLFREGILSRASTTTLENSESQSFAKRPHPPELTLLFFTTQNLYFS